MEPKVILYITIAIGYFIYSIVKKAQESKQAEPPKSNPTYSPAKPVSPPTTDPLADIMREIKRKQAEAEAAKARQIAANKPKPLTSAPLRKEPREMLIHEKRKGIFEEGNYERGLTEEEKIERGKLKIANEGIYKIKSIEEMEEEDTAYRLDMRGAIIGSTILERKY